MKYVMEIKILFSSKPFEKIGTGNLISKIHLFMS